VIHAGSEGGIEGRLREAEALLRMAAKVGRLGAWSYDVRSKELTWSEEVCAIHELPPGSRPSVEEALKFYPPGSRRLLGDAFLACMTRGVPYDLELQIVTAGQRHLWVRTIGYAERGPDGEVVTVQGAFQDISTTRAAAEYNRELAERLTMTLESMTDAFFTIDREWRFTYLNSEAARVLQRDRDALIGNVIWAEFPESIGSDIHRRYEEALTDNVPVELETFYPPLQIWVQLRAFPSPQGLAVSFRDVSDRVRSHAAILRLNAELEDRVRSRTAELQAANRELETFAYSVAHDLRSPLAAMNCFAQMLQETERAVLSERGVHYVQRIRAAATQMDNMTKGLLELARVSKTRLRQEPVDLGEIAGVLFADLRAQSPGRKTDIVLHPRLCVVGDEVLLTQLMSNLVGNAWKFTWQKAVTRIEVGAFHDEAGQIVYFVRDNGAGFDMAHADRLFEPFQRLHSNTEFDGTGVGLATVQRIVSRHQGRVWAEAAPGKGATIYFTLQSGSAEEAVWKA
jgi:PAS domain S-box-containing protein